MGLILGYLLAIIVPLIFLLGIFKLDFYQTGQFKYVVLSFLWGGIAYILAASLNWSLVNERMATWEQIVRFIAPFAEEILKGLFIVYLVHTAHFTYSVDGAVYGFATGIGFAIFENMEYIHGHTEVATWIAIQRVLSTNLVHAAGSAIIGMALSMFRLERSIARWEFLLSGLSLAIGLHMGFNLMVSSGAHLAIAIGIGLLGATYIYYSISRGLLQAQRWIQERLGMVDRVTEGEAVIVNRIQNLDEILLPVYERFGPAKTEQVQKFLRIQARLGIMRKTLENLDERSRCAVEAEMDVMRAEVDEIRCALGAYVMMFVRGAYSEDTISIWDQLQARVETQSDATAGQKGGGLWSSLNNRIQTATDIKQNE